VMKRCPVWAVVISAAIASPADAQNPARGTIALSPLQAPPPYSTFASVRVLDSLLTTELSAAGYMVVSGAEAGAVWKHLLDSVQGFYDPISGDRDSVKYEAVRRGTMRDLASRLHATLWLHDTITVVSAHWSHNAKWDGMTESVGVGKGDVPALSLLVSIEDTSGRTVAFGRGGLQVLYKMHGDKYERVPPDKLFTETERMLKGVRLALQPLLAKGGAP
jgi:hypothetical protein